MQKIQSVYFMQRRSVEHNPNPVGINLMAFCVGRIHFFDHQNKHLLRLSYMIFSSYVTFCPYWLYTLP